MATSLFFLIFFLSAYTMKLMKKKVSKKPKKVLKNQLAKKSPKKKLVKKKLVGKIAKKPVLKKKAAGQKPAKRKTVGQEVVHSPDIFAGVHKTKVRVIGVGGGGGTIVSEIISRVKKADFVIANTDAKALKLVKKAKKFQFGTGVTKGLGTGMNVEVGEAAAIEDKERIEKLFEGQDVCIIVSSLGGGSGSGAMPVFAKLAKNSKCLTYGIFTLPFEFEGSKKMEMARDALNRIRPHLNAFSIIPNERIFQIIDKNTPLGDALSAINSRLADNLSGLIDMIYSPGVINIDFADLREVLSGRGKLAYLNTVDINTANKEEAAKKVVSSMLYPYTIKGAMGIVYNIVGNRNIQLAEVSAISKIIADTINKNAKIIFGINHNKDNSDKIKITLLATGCQTKGVIEKKPKIEKKIKKAVKPKKPVPTFPNREKEKDKESAGESNLENPLPVKPVKKPVEKETVSKKPIAKKTVKKVKKAAKKVPAKPEVVKASVESADVSVRRNALQVRRAIEEEESELLQREREWDTPAILRNKDNS